MIRFITVALSFLLLQICGSFALAGPFDGILSNQSQAWIHSDKINATERECTQRVGPFATQQTAWNRWNQAKSQGYNVSSGVFPCWENGGRGYCFNVFYVC
jgi:hypothetical protein